MPDLSIETLCQSCQADPRYSASVTKHGQTCEIGTDTVSADSINETCNRLLVGMAKAQSQACGLSPSERKAARIKRRADRKAQHEHDEAMRASFAMAMSQEYQLKITPEMIGIGIFGLLIAMWGGIPMLLLCVASVCFEHWLEGQLFDDPKVAAIGVE
jgi:hypothetical protein